MLPKKENKKCQFMFFNSRSTSRSVLAFKMLYCEILVNYKVLDHQVLLSGRKNQVNPTLE